MKISPLLLLLGLFLAAPVLRAQPSPDPETFVMNFLAWYLPEAFAKGADVVFDKRMDAAIDPETLTAWRKEQRGEGIGAVPFVGQDYDDAWAKGFKVTTVEESGDEVAVTVQYTGTEMSQTMRFMVVPTDAGWRIREGNPVE